MTACRCSEARRPDRLSGVRPQERVPRRIVEQIVDSAPVLPLLHDPEPQLVDSVVEVRKILDNLLPDVEQVIKVPKILPHTVPQRSSLQEPQTARGTRPRRRWCCLVPHCGAHVVHARARHWLGATASPGRYINTGQRRGGRPCDHALQVPAVLADLQWMVPQIPFIDRVLASSVASQRQGSQCKLFRRPEIPWCSSGKVSTRPLVCKRQVQKTTVILQLQFIERWSMSLVRWSRFSGAGVEETVVPQLQLLRNPSRFRTCSWTRSLTCPLLSTTGYCTVEVPQFSSSPVFVDIPVVQHRRVRCFQHFLLMAAMTGFLTHFASFFALLRLCRS